MSRGPVVGGQVVRGPVVRGRIDVVLFLRHAFQSQTLQLSSNGRQHCTLWRVRFKWPASRTRFIGSLTVLAFALAAKAKTVAAVE